MHEDLTGGHFGMARTLATVWNRYYWEGMAQDVENWVKSCKLCNTRKSPRNAQRAPLMPIPVEGPWDRLAVDAIGPLPVTNNGNRYIVVFIDYLTKWPEAFAVPDITAKTIARLLFDEIICRHSAPKVLLSDRGTNFLSNIVKELCRYFDIHKVQTTAYHPQCDGMCERLNSTLYDRLAMYTNDQHTDWDVYLPAALFACRISPATESTQHSPFFLMYGREARLPIDAMIKPPEKLTDSVTEYIQEMVSKVEFARDLAKKISGYTKRSIKHIMTRGQKNHSLK